MNATSFRLGQILLLAIAMVACRSQQKPAVYPTIYSLILTDTQVADFTEKASHGDGDAAFKLSQFYFMVKLERDTGLKWLTKAAECGHTIAQYNMGFCYDGKTYPDLTDIKKAKYWYQRAADNGHKEAKLRLEELSR